MKSILFVLLMRLNGEAEPIAVFESLEQCRTAQINYTQNIAATYHCYPVDVRGTWSKH